MKYDDRNLISFKRLRFRYERYYYRYEIFSSRLRFRERSYVYYFKKRYKKYKFREYERYRFRLRFRERYGYYSELNFYNYYDSRFYFSSRLFYEDEYYLRMLRLRFVDDRRDWDYGRLYSRVIEVEYDRFKKYVYRFSSEDLYFYRSKKFKKVKKYKKYKKYKKRKVIYILFDFDFDIIVVGRFKLVFVEV